LVRTDGYDHLYERGVGPKPDGSRREEESNTHKYRGLASIKKVCKAFTLKWAQAVVIGVER
jgi:hypothetical protein